MDVGQVRRIRLEMQEIGETAFPRPLPNKSPKKSRSNCVAKWSGGERTGWEADDKEKPRKRIDFRVLAKNGKKRRSMPLP